MPLAIYCFNKEWNCDQVLGVAADSLKGNLCLAAAAAALTMAICQARKTPFAASRFGTSGTVVLPEQHTIRPLFPCLLFVFPPDRDGR